LMKVSGKIFRVTHCRSQDNPNDLRVKVERLKYFIEEIKESLIELKTDTSINLNEIALLEKEIELDIGYYEAEILKTNNLIKRLEDKLTLSTNIEKIFEIGQSFKDCTEKGELLVRTMTEIQAIDLEQFIMNELKNDSSKIDGFIQTLELMINKIDNRLEVNKADAEENISFKYQKPNYISMLKRLKKYKENNSLNSKTEPPKKEKKEETLSNLIAHEKAIEIVKKMKIKHKNTKNKKLKLLLLAFQELELIEKVNKAAAFHRCFLKEINTDAGKYQAMNDYRFNDAKGHPDPKELESMKQFIKTIINP